MKPKIEDVLDIVLLKEQISRLYDEIDEKVLKLKNEFGANRFDYDLSGMSGDFIDELKDKGQFLKFEIVDNLENLQTDGKLFQTTSFKPVTFSFGSLKNRPKSL